MNKIAVVFGGQGSQYEKMGSQILKKYPEISYIYNSMGDELKKIAFEDEIDKISLTNNLQPIMLAFQLSTLELLKKYIKAESTCGLSLGEYGALVLSESISSIDAMNLIKKRAEAMYKAAQKTSTSMLAVIKVPVDELEMIIDENFSNQIYIANINSSNQIVVAGENDSIEKLNVYLKNKGYRSILLKVSGAFHTPFMKDAADEYQEWLNKITFKNPKLKYYPNITGEVYKKGNLKIILKNQITSPVLLYKTLQNMVDDGIDYFIEIGPGNVISNIIKKEFKTIKTKSLSNDDEVIKFIEELKNGI